jgi:hypothetical protein
MSMFDPYHFAMLPAPSRSGIARVRNHLWAPSARRIRNSMSNGLPSPTVLAHSA